MTNNRLHAFRIVLLALVATEFLFGSVAHLQRDRCMAAWQPHINACYADALKDARPFDAIDACAAQDHAALDKCFGDGVLSAFNPMPRRYEYSREPPTK